MCVVSVCLLTAAIQHLNHTVLAAIDCNVWLEYVQSGANIADQPSRGDVSLLLSMGSLPFDMELPPVGGDWAAIYEALFVTLAPRPSRGVKRRSQGN